MLLSDEHTLQPENNTVDRKLIHTHNFSHAPKTNFCLNTADSTRSYSRLGLFKHSKFQKLLITTTTFLKSFKATRTQQTFSTQLPTAAVTNFHELLKLIYSAFLRHRHVLPLELASFTSSSSLENRLSEIPLLRLSCMQLHLPLRKFDFVLFYSGALDKDDDAEWKGREEKRRRRRDEIHYSCALFIRGGGGGAGAGENGPSRPGDRKSGG